MNVNRVRHNNIVVAKYCFREMKGHVVFIHNRIKFRSIIN